MSGATPKPAPLTARRLEARPFEWELLTEQQREAVRLVARLIAEAVNDTEQSGEGIHALQTRRRSQIAFVDGDRGTGKTSVLLTLHGLTQRGSSWTAPGGEEDLGRLVELRERIVWLETLDMEPLGRRSNLFAAILARIDAVCAPVKSGVLPPIAMDLDPLDAGEDALSKLQNLQNDAVIVWDGTLPDRGARIDPSAYAAEVLRAERAGLELNARLATVMEKLAELRNATRSGGRPVFVLPVDDFDLAPARCLELLRLIRTVMTPRLFFLVAGSVRLAEKALKLHSEGELAALAGSALSQRYWDERITPIGLEVGANNIRKLVPPQQRARLAPVDLEEALRFSVGRDGTTTTLHDVLKEVHFQRNTAPAGAGEITLAEFLLVGPEEQGIYSATRWLAGTPRQVLDLAMCLARHRGKAHGYGEELLRDVGEELSRDTLEEWRLDSQLRDRIGDLLDTSVAIRFDFSRALALDVEQSWVSEVPFEHGRAELRPLRAVSLRSVQGPRSPEQDEPTALGPQVPEHVASGLVLLHDLASYFWGGYLQSRSLFHARRQELPFALTRWGDVEVPWIAPDWWTLRENERFQSRWRELRGELAMSEAQLGDEALAWLTAMLEVLCDAAPFEATGSRGVSRNAAIDSVRELAGELAAERPTRISRTMLRKSALVATALVMSPEVCPEVYYAKGRGTKDGAWFEKRFAGLSGELAQPDVAKRVRAWRASAVRTILVKEVPTRERALLMAAIAPDSAVDWVRSEIDNDRPDGVPFPENLDEPTSPEAIAGLQSWLAHHGCQLRPSERSLLEAAIAVLPRPFVAHPINQLGGGALVPTQADVDAARPAVAVTDRP